MVNRANVRRDNAKLEQQAAIKTAKEEAKKHCFECFLEI
jgi:hypothetical protein